MKPAIQTIQKPDQYLNLFEYWWLKNKKKKAEDLLKPIDPQPATDPTPAPATDPTPAPATDPTPAKDPKKGSTIFIIIGILAVTGILITWIVTRKKK